ncbi:MAG: hypothetical protein WC989_03845 [Micavibrio sp.]
MNFPTAGRAKDAGFDTGDLDILSNTLSGKTVNCALQLHKMPGAGLLESGALFQHSPDSKEFIPITACEKNRHA